MSRALLATATVLAIAVSPAAQARAAGEKPNRNLVENLVPLIAKQCTPIGDRRGEIKAVALYEALLSKDVVTFEDNAPLIGRPGRVLAPIFIAGKGDNRKAYLLVSRTVGGWTAPTAEGAGRFLPLAYGGIEVHARSGGPLGTADTAAVLADILDRSDANYRFVCILPGESSPPPADGGEVAQVLIAKEPTDFAAAKLTDRPFAEFAYLRDEDAGTDTYSFYGTLGIGFGDRPIGKEAYDAGRSHIMARVRPLAFAQLEYEKASDAATAKVDNLDFGLQLGGVVQTRWKTTVNHFYALSVRYLTDTRFDSSGWSVAAQWSPRFSIPGNLVAAKLGGGVYFSWNLTGVGDHAGFSDIGRKADLATAPHYTRLGFDAAADLRLKLANADILSFGGTYALRKNLERGLGDAERFGLRLTFAPSDNLSIGIGYDRGRNLDTLEHTRTVKLIVGIRK
ncbi:MAG: hypothetical protein ABIS51_18090 [Sphingomonas sp.]